MATDRDGGDDDDRDMKADAAANQVFPPVFLSERLDWKAGFGQLISDPDRDENARNNDIVLPSNPCCTHCK
ncbi:hypothetical protein CH63R_09471 [Colletotrichum higginsianum IMI 349063]|uniref:Uncharacterized protein n=1 Tax=Colletotrichum higginsianum (strain IMI 349063) TaxID=759273 RepID=A0A1B7Y7G7_COLHI|nr:hypothetical protein CH63R_09471 [Colletotrichum higginsianum IMI 349063]OBR07950.1 hypothetical protein CH63R_09471 [Colletotrichum higginsianum IMI 349063]